MRPLHRVRKDILKLTQAEMAAVARTTQATISRWETGELEPSRDQLSLILEYARENRIELSADEFFQQSESTDGSTFLESGAAP